MLGQRTAESKAWQYFRVVLPVNKAKLRAAFDAASERMRPSEVVLDGDGLTLNARSNTKGEYMEMRDFCRELVEMPWTFARPSFTEAVRGAKSPYRRQHRHRRRHSSP